MKIGKRDLKQLSKAIFAKQHYFAFINIFLVCHNPYNFFKRYFFRSGIYPVKIALRTPIGRIDPEIYSYSDILTVNEVFCRIDYKAKKDIKVVVDIGSNIGISALYFLTRNKDSRCYLFEPVPDNIGKSKSNLQNFKDRYVLSECAVTNNEGFRRFGVEPTGRYGGLNRKTENFINVQCRDINKILSSVIESDDRIDILKVDIEGDEIDVLRSIDEKILEKIKNIYFEIDSSLKINPVFSYYPEMFSCEKYGETFILKNKKF